MIPNRLSASYPWVMMTMKLKPVHMESSSCGMGGEGRLLACSTYCFTISPALKLAHIDIYNRRLAEREKRKRCLIGKHWCTCLLACSAGVMLLQCILVYMHFRNSCQNVW